MTPFVIAPWPRTFSISVPITGKRVPGKASCQRINIIRQKPKSKKISPLMPVLDADHLVIGRDDVLPPEGQLVMIVLCVVVGIVRGVM